LRRTAGGETGSTAETVDYLIDVLRIAPEKLFVGLAFYGYQFAGNGLASTLVKPTTNLDYRLIAPLEGVAGWTKRWDATAEVPTLVRAASPGFVSFEDPRSIGRKCEWASERRLGGSIVWHLAGDRMVDGRQPLLEAAQRCR
jgi:chitinase